MGVWDRVKAFFGVTKAAPFGVSWTRAGSGFALPVRNTSALLAAYSTSPWLRAVTGRISDSVAGGLKWQLRRDGVQIEDHPLLDLLRRPTPDLPGSVTWRVVQLHRDLTGEALLLIDRDAAGRPAALTPIPPDLVLQVPTFAAPYYLVQLTTGTRQYQEADVLWLPDPDPRNPWGRGASIAAALSQEIDIDEGATRNLAAWFVNGCTPDVLVTLEGARPEELDRAKVAFQQKFLGPDRAHRTHFQTRKLDIQRLDTTFKDQELPVLRRDQRDRILQIFGVPPELFGVLENSNRATIEAANYLFSLLTVQPRVLTLVEEINSKLAPQFGPGLRVEVPSVVPEDRDFVIRAVATAPAAFTVGDVRTLCGLRPSPWDAERLTTAPISAGPTNVPPGKSLQGFRLDVLPASPGTSEHE